MRDLMGSTRVDELRARLASIEAHATLAADEAFALREWIDTEVQASRYTARLPWFEAKQIGDRLAIAARYCQETVAEYADERAEGTAQTTPVSDDTLRPDRTP